MTRRLLALGVVALAACHPPPVARPAELPDAGPWLEARAVLPADTFAAGPPSGARLDAAQAHGRALPFATQPVQGFSALLAEGDGDFLGLADNGYGAPDNSDDFLLRAYHLAPDFTRGTIRAELAFTLSDPDQRLPFTPVRALLGDRQLTGADLDPEAFQPDGDGGYWVGEELGPFLVHVDGEGRVLAAPLEVPATGGGCATLRAPTHPGFEEAAVLRAAQALRLHAEAHGGAAPVLSPHHLLVADAPAGSDGGVSSELFDVRALGRAGFSTVPWTVNEPARMRELFALGVSGLISDRPDLLRAEASAADAGIDVQGHRGARGLRPENTLPAFEAALDARVDTLESDVALTADGLPVLWHDFVLPAGKCRPLDARAAKAEPVIRDTPLAKVQAYACDRLQSAFPEQKNAAALSPVSAAFAKRQRLRSPYVPVTVEQLFDFAAAYQAWYSTGPGRRAPGAARRAETAARVRFNLETKVDRREALRTLSPEPDRLTRALLERVSAKGLADRVTLQSFDFGTLLLAQGEAPQVRTVLLFGDGDNLAPEGERPSPFLAGLSWPYGQRWAGCPPRVARSGGFEALGRAPSGRLLAAFEKPVQGEGVLAVPFDPPTRTFGPERWRFELPERAHSLTELQLTGERTGLALVRDDTEGRLDGYKWVMRFELPPGGGAVHLEPLVNLLALRAPGQAAVAGEVGTGDPFAMPFITIESLVVLGPRRLAIANDNNYPFSVGRHLGSGQPDDTELIVVGY